MKVDFKHLQRTLAEHKVYNAWPYVSSLYETMEYLSVSFNLIQKVYDHRRNELASIGDEILQGALSHPGTPIALTTAHLQRTNLNIVGYEINDIVFLRKTTIEFMHYARVCMDLLIQITNAALFGDEAFDVEDIRIAVDVSHKLSTDDDFTVLKALFDSILNNAEYKYLLAFDNYLKHIKTILIKVQNSIVLGNKNEFMLDSFVYKGTNYLRRDAISAANAVYQMVIDKTDEVLSEVLVQIPNVKNTASRIHELQFEQVVKQSPESTAVESITFFITVKNDLSEVPEEISVYPLIIKPSGEICSFDFRLEEIFIRRMRNDETYDILGYAKIKNGFDTNEFYRKYVVSSCDYSDYAKYLYDFTKKYPSVSLNYHALSGRIICV